MSGNAIKDPFTEFHRGVIEKIIPGNGKNKRLASELLMPGLGDIPALGGVGKIAKAFAPNPGEPPALGEAPAPGSAQVAQAAADQRRARGRASTILSNSSSSTPSSARRTLLGS